ncbi:MAG: DNRLRE domain-containing protein [Xanthomonadales bacterium]|nr:DNRLRE domain-containing protein [Xanthomonadales bacterium]
MQGRGITCTMVAMFLFSFAHQNLRADIVELSAVQDTTLYEDAAGRLGNGSGQYLFVGRTWDENGIDALLRRALIKFDLGSVPPGSTINSVSFGFTINQAPPAATSATISLHTMTEDWGEGASNAPGPEGRGTIAQINDATWLHRFFDSELWNTAGGDFAAVAVASEPISSSPQSVTFATSPQLVAAVQAWIDNPATNHGWALLGDEIFPQNARRILSREHTGPGNPLLTLDFTPGPAVAIPAVAIPATSTMGLLILVLLLLILSRIFLRTQLTADDAKHLGT